MGKLAAARALAHASNSRLLAIHGQRLLELPLEAFSDLARRAIREARLQSAVLYWADFDLLLEDEQAARWQILRDLLREAAEDSPICVVLAGERSWDAGDAFTTALHPDASTLPACRSHMPDSDRRLKLWKACLAGEADEDFGSGCSPIPLERRADPIGSGISS